LENLRLFAQEWFKMADTSRNRQKFRIFNSKFTSKSAILLNKLPSRCGRKIIGRCTYACGVNSLSIPLRTRVWIRNFSPLHPGIMGHRWYTFLLGILNFYGINYSHRDGTDSEWNRSYLYRHDWFHNPPLGASGGSKLSHRHMHYSLCNMNKSVTCEAPLNCNWSGGDPPHPPS